MDTVEQLTPQQLAPLLRVTVRSEQILAQTGSFLKQIDKQVSERIAPTRKDIGISAPSDNFQFIDRAYYYLFTKRSTGLPTLSVYLLPDRLWWGISTWGDEESMNRMAAFLQQLGVADEEPVVQKGSFTPAWKSGAYLLLGREMTADEIEQQSNVTTLLRTIAEDLVDYYHRLSPHVKTIEEQVDYQVQKLPESLQHVHDFFAAVFPEPDYRRRCLSIFADAIEEAHEIGESAWVITKPGNGVGFNFNVGKHQTLSFGTEGIGIRVDLDEATEDIRAQLGDRVKRWGPGGNKAIPSSGWAEVAPEHFAEVWSGVHPAYLAHLKRAISLTPSTLYKRSYRPEFVQYLRQALGQPVPHPAHYTPSASPRRNVKIAPGRNARFWDDCLANGYICVGWDDVGDLEAFEEYEAFEEAFRDRYADLYNSNKPTIRQKAEELWTLTELEPGDIVVANKGKRRVLAVGTVVEPGYEWNSERSEFRHTVHVEWNTEYAQDIPTQSYWGFRTVLPLTETEYQYILNRNWPPPSKSVDIVECLHSSFTAKGFYFTPWQIATFFTALQTKGFVILSGISGTGKSKLAQYFARALPNPDGAENWHFTPVRPDWRDSKSLLGYYNPLTETYEWTPFLRFLLRAADSYQQDEQRAWFVILDEMNLAHVEYYFADLLSVLESGRDDEGWTREALQLVYPDEAAGDLPPHKIYMPPNLYVVGTVNVDETTHAFSPKVQDRAFTLELTEADFNNYPPAAIDGDDVLSKETREGLLEAFSSGDRFAQIEKETVAEYVADNPEVRQRLQRLNEQLRPYGFHFGYRVFDEIVAFLVNALDTGIYESVIVEDAGARFTGLDETDLAFDAAVLMKILPKFHGSRGQLEQPLMKLLAWALNPDSPDKSLSDVDVTQVELLRSLPYRFPYTAERLQRMLQILYITGFAT